MKWGAGVGAYGLFGMQTLQASAPTGDYKAIVVVYLGGGNDSLNMFIPSGNDPKKGYANYYNIRDNIRVSDTELTLSTTSDGKLDLTGGNPYASNSSLVEGYTKGFYRHTNAQGNDLGYATNALMPELGHLVNQGKVAIVANCGNLIEPATKQELQDKRKALPPFLFAHNHQTKLAFNGEASLLNYTGWAGRIADIWQGVNGGSLYGLNIGINRNPHLFDAEVTSPIIIRSIGPQSYESIKREMHNRLMNVSRRDMFDALYTKLRKHSFLAQDTLVSDWNDSSKVPDFSSVTNAYGGTLFSYPDDATLDQNHEAEASPKVLDALSAVARMIGIGNANGLSRQIFYVEDGGYDSHHDQAETHSRKLRGLSMGLGDFYRALESMGLQDKVTLITVSEFGRSTGNNDNGTDHAWGGSYFMLGGAVQGGLYGTLPDLTLASDDDLTHKGRLIPTTSFTQYYATALKWFGLDDTELNAVLPELPNFSLKDLGCF